MIKYKKDCKELTIEQLKNTNGCGSSYPLLWIFRIPKWMSRAFYRCCNRHDLSYQNQEGKNSADDELYNCWMYNAYHSPWWQKHFKIKIAEIGYAAITSKLSNTAYKFGKR